MAIDWEYAQASKWIAEHGGPQKAFETVKKYYTAKGFKEGAASKNPVIALVGVASLAAGVAGKCVYDKIKEKKALEIKKEFAEQAKVKKAEAELVAAMERATKVENELLNEPDEASPEHAKESTSI